MRFITSDNIDQGDRPVISLNYTQVVNVSISPGTQNTDVDTPVQFGSTCMISQPLHPTHQLLVLTNGTISSNGLLPIQYWNPTASAGWGVQCAKQRSGFTGCSTTLFAYTNPDVSQMTADESLEVVTGVRDQMETS